MSEAFDRPRSHSSRKPVSARQSGDAENAPARLSPLALLSAIFGGASIPLSIICFLSLPSSAAAIILGHVARYQIRRSGSKERGAGLALLGLGLGYFIFTCSLAALGFLGYHVINAPPSTSVSEEGPRTAKTALDQAEAKILTSTHGKGQGNTPDARVMAEKFATMMEEVHKEAFTKSGAKLKLSGGHYVTWCERHEGTCAFVVHVPEYRRFTEDAKESLNELAWTAAQLTTLGELQPGERVAVGLRGVMLYGSVMLGSAGSDGTLGLNHSTGTDGSDLHPFFDPDRALPAAGANRESPVDYSAVARSLPPDPTGSPLTSGPTSTVSAPPDVATPTAAATIISDPPTIAATASEPEPEAASEEIEDPSSPPSEPATSPTTDAAEAETVPPSRRRRPTGPKRPTERPDSRRSRPDVSRDPGAPPTRRFSMPESAAEAVALLDSEDRLTRSLAQSYLTSHKPEAPDSETAGKLVDALKEARGGEAYSLTMALDGWVTPDQLTDLEKLLESKDTTIHHQLHRIIGKIGTIEAAKVLAKQLNDPQDRFSASIAIKSIGKTAEPAIIPLLASKNSDVCLEACRILQEIGTKKSVSGLQRLTKSKNFLISTTAKTALDQVRGR